MRKAGLVSTIIPVHNRPVLLKESVKSVVSQTYRPIEIIIVNDGSTDDTGTVAKQLCETFPQYVKVIGQHNRGPGPARETGRKAAAGEFIQYLDSDDVLLPSKFELQVGGLNTNPDADVAYGKTRYRREDGSIDEGSWKPGGGIHDAMFPSFLQSRWWETGTPLYRASICDRAGPWKDLWVDEDWEYDCRIASLGAKLHYVPEIICEYRSHGDNRFSHREPNATTLESRAKTLELILSHARKADIPTSSPEMQHFARGLFLLSRQCGAVGLTKESRKLFNLSREASERYRANGTDYRLYKLVASFVGWRNAGKLSAVLDELRNRVL